MFCPTKDGTLAAVLALLPRGRAWQSHEGGPEPYHNAAFDAGAFDPEVFDATDIKGSMIYRYFSAFAEVLTFATTRACDLVNEFFCNSIVETRPEWMTEYNLPDNCDPFPDLCDKVAARGGSRCEYFNQRIARMGWRAECFERAMRCGAQTGCFRTGSRRAVTGNSSSLALVVRVHTNEAPAVTPSQRIRIFQTGRMRTGWRPSCDTRMQPSIEPVRCLMERIVPAHIVVQYIF